MTFWLWVCFGCAASAAAGFTFTRFAVASRPQFRAADAVSIPVRAELPEDVVRLPRADLMPEPPVEPPAAEPRQRATRTRAPATVRAAATRTPPPTAPRPDAEKLALWARQIKAGERKMTIATDGCRVTWNRTCKHGHPSWLVRLGYLKRPRPPKARPTPR